MLADVQSGVVNHLSQKLDAGFGSGDDGLLQPQAVKPYGGELHKPKRLSKRCPITYVEFDNAILDAADLGGTHLRGTETVHVICCALNQAGGRATASDGVRLLSWAALALAGLRLQLDGRQAGFEKMGVQRLLSGERLWAAALTPQLIIN